jgi:hypothetical protein
MKTKQRSPWNIKPGDMICVYTYPDQAEPHAVEVRRVEKYRSKFTGRTVWKFHYTHPYDPTRTDWTICHGGDRRRPAMLGNLPAEKILVPA